MFRNCNSLGSSSELKTLRDEASDAGGAQTDVDYPYFSARSPVSPGTGDKPFSFYSAVPLEWMDI